MTADYRLFSEFKRLSEKANPFVSGELRLATMTLAYYLHTAQGILLQQLFADAPLEEGPALVDQVVLGVHGQALALLRAVALHPFNQILLLAGQDAHSFMNHLTQQQIQTLERDVNGSWAIALLAQVFTIRIKGLGHGNRPLCPFFTAKLFAPCDGFHLGEEAFDMLNAGVAYAKPEAASMLVWTIYC
ncbi:MAG: hypothetical protein ABSB49_05125 [Polyangia bacterium]